MLILSRYTKLYWGILILCVLKMMPGNLVTKNDWGIIRKKQSTNCIYHWHLGVLFQHIIAFSTSFSNSASFPYQFTSDLFNLHKCAYIAGVWGLRVPRISDRHPSWTWPLSVLQWRKGGQGPRVATHDQGWGLPWDDRTQVGPKLAPWSLLTG